MDIAGTTGVSTHGILYPSSTHAPDDTMPLNIIKVVGMYRHRQIECLVQLLSSTCVDHARLNILSEKEGRADQVFNIP